MGVARVCTQEGRVTRVANRRPHGHPAGLGNLAQVKEVLNRELQQNGLWSRSPVPAQPHAAGIEAGDVIVGVDDRALHMDVSEFNRYVSRHYLVGDQVAVNVLRDGKRLKLPMRLLR